MLVIPFPNIDPVAINLGPLNVHWYGISYVVGIILSWKYVIWLTKKQKMELQGPIFDNFLNWCVLGIIVGGRLGQVLFFSPSYYFSHPLEIPMVWKGGMSFHGGLLGVTIATLVYCYRSRINPFSFADIMSAGVPLGIFCGRIANFINAELYGRPTNVSWAVVFPGSDGLPRHPSQLYEAFGEGICLFLLLFWAWHKTNLSRVPGRITGLFFVGYGLARFLAEFVRDSEWFYSFGGIITLSSGQILSIPLLILGAAWLMRRS